MLKISFSDKMDPFPDDVPSQAAEEEGNQQPEIHADPFFAGEDEQGGRF